jgi:UDP-N-acetyl-2-amino-2-deoxyglucuronate dehydrogenase
VSADHGARCALEHDFTEAMAIGIGVVGAGAAGTEHAEVYSRASRARIVAIADEDLSKAERLHRRYGSDLVVADHREVLRHPDVSVVSICTPPSTHAQIALDAIAAGKHVLCEKPFTISSAQAHAVQRAASLQPSLCVSCVFQHRDDPAVARARWLIDSGRLGAVGSAHFAVYVHRTTGYFTDDKGTYQREGGGALAVQGIHLLDLLIWLLGDAETCSAATEHALHEIEVEDTFAGWVRLARGCLATIDCSTAASRDTYRIDVIGSDASLTLSLQPGWARAWKLAVSSSSHPATLLLRHRTKQVLPGYPRGQRSVHVARLACARLTGHGSRPRHLGHGPHIRRFLDAIQYGQRAPIPPSEACKSVELAESLYRSASHPQANPLEAALAA